MEFAVHGKQMDVGDSLRTHVRQKIEDLSEKYLNHTTHASVTFSKDGHGKKDTRAHIFMQLGHDIRIIADGIEKDPYVAFDTAAEKAVRQLRRYKNRLRDHHDRMQKAAESEKAITAMNYVLSADNDDSKHEEAPAEHESLVIAEMTTAIQSLTVNEAVMRLDLSGEPALMFRNAAHGGLNMVYRRSDGNIGWVDPEKTPKTVKAKK